MSLTAVSRCLQCHAVVNVHWTACLVCKTLLSHVESQPASRSLQIGECVSWEVPPPQKIQRGVVDFLHTDADGTVWAFCTTKEGWAAVNSKSIAS